VQAAQAFLVTLTSPRPCSNRYEVYRNPRRADHSQFRWPQCPLDRCCGDGLSSAIGMGSCSPKTGPKQETADCRLASQQMQQEIQSLQQATLSLEQSTQSSTEASKQLREPVWIVMRRPQAWP